MVEIKKKKPATKKAGTTKPSIKPVTKKVVASKTTPKQAPKKAVTSKDPKAGLVYIVINRNKNEVIWKLKDKKKPKDLTFKSQKEAVEHFKTSYRWTKALVQGQHGKWAFSVMIKDKKQITTEVFKPKPKPVEPKPKPISKPVKKKKSTPKKVKKTNISKNSSDRSIRKQLTGIVVSTKMEKTIVVKVDTYKKHPLYSKRFLSSKKFKVHDENKTANDGDKVLIAETRPYSKTKTFRLVKVLEAHKDGE